jgi:PII-like signaling protein
MANWTDASVLRVTIAENDHHDGRALHEVILHAALDAGLSGGTVYRGLMGFGDDRRIHSARILRLSDALPVIIEIVDETERIKNFVEHLESMLRGRGMVVVSPAQRLVPQAEPDAEGEDT